jgi:hypothetical protein
VIATIDYFDNISSSTKQMKKKYYQIPLASPKAFSSIAQRDTQLLFFAAKYSKHMLKKIVPSIIL